MKKSLITLITFALVLVNLVLTAVMALRVVPEVNKVNNLVGKISEAIDLEISAGDEKTGGASVSIDNIEPYEITDNLTINLRRGDDGEDHYAVLKVALSLNKKSEAYAAYNATTIGGYESVIRTEINNIVASYTIDEIRSDQQAVMDEIKARLNTLFGSDLVAAVGFSTVNYQ